MTTFLKIFLAIFIALALAHFFPVLLLPVILLAGLGALIGLVLAGGAALVSAVGGAVIGLLAIVCCALLTAFAPLLIPVLLVVGVVALIRALTRRAV